MEAYPDQLQARIELSNRQLGNLAQSAGAPRLSLVLDKTKKWNQGRPGATVTVGFRGGSPELRRLIADACSEWTKPGRGQVTLDFGQDAPNGRFREWSTSDTQYAAQVRIAFDQQGYWSLVGTDSNNPAVAGPSETSLNLAGFDVQLPADARGVAIHECGHALGAEHEHQNPVNGCDSEFRFDDDPGYLPTKDPNGQFIPDNQHRRPGLYTYLGGWPNFWPRSKVDFNLRQLPPSSAWEIGHSMSNLL